MNKQSPGKSNLDTLMSSQINERKEEIKTLLTTKNLKENELTNQLNDLEDKLRITNTEIKELENSIDGIE